ncbi:MAG: fibronectin type III domain-containing protein [bacterium]
MEIGAIVRYYQVVPSQADQKKAQQAPQEIGKTEEYRVRNLGVDPCKPEEVEALSWDAITPKLVDQLILEKKLSVPTEKRSEVVNGVKKYLSTTYPNGPYKGTIMEEGWVRDNIISDKQYGFYLATQCDDVDRPYNIGWSRRLLIVMTDILGRYAGTTPPLNIDLKALQAKVNEILNPKEKNADPEQPGDKPNAPVSRPVVIAINTVVDAGTRNEADASASIAPPVAPVVPPPPPKPRVTGLKVVPGETSAKITWNALDGAKKYIIKGGPDNWKVVTSPYEMQGLDDNTSYKITIVAVMPDKTESAPASKTFKTKEKKKLPTKPLCACDLKVDGNLLLGNAFAVSSCKKDVKGKTDIGAAKFIFDNYLKGDKKDKCTLTK